MTAAKNPSAIDPSPSGEAIRIVYHFDFDGEDRVSWEVKLHPDTLTLLPQARSGPPPAWTALDACKCDRCPLEAATSPTCPAALALSDVAQHLSPRPSTTVVDVRVDTAERSYVRRGPFQQALQGLFGLVMPTSGCPRLAFLRPMARFHLPFATYDETIVRSTSMHLLRQYIRARRGGPETFDLAGLSREYAAAGDVNRGISARLRGIGGKDGSRNAVVILDSFARMARMDVDDDFPELDRLFPPTA